MKKPAGTTNIELTSKDVEIEKLAEQPIVEVKIKFCTHVGWDGVLLLYPECSGESPHRHGLVGGEGRHFRDAILKSSF